MMRLDLFRRLKKHTGQYAFGNVLYNWTLGGAAPRGFIVSLTDVWPGDAGRGRWLCGIAAPEADGREWEADGAGEHWAAYMHGFEWLRDLKAMGGDQARAQARGMTEEWIRRYGGFCQPSVWRPEYTGARLASWVMLYDFFGASAGEEFQDRFFFSLARQARHLSRAASGVSPGLGAFHAARGLVCTGIALQGRESWLEQGLDLLQEETEKQILPDGGHVSRNPQTLLEALQIFIDIRAALLAGGYPVPGPLQYSIDRMAQALRFLRYPDRRFAVFNGTQEGDLDLIEAALARSNAQGKLLKGLPQSGYERMTLGRSVVMIDCSAPPRCPYDRQAHAAPLSFEFAYGKERVFVSCGSHPSDAAWQDCLRATAAHNTVTLDSRNAGEIRGDGHFGRRPRKIALHREESRDAVLIEAAHDGYGALSGITHRRRLYLGDQGHDLRGEETLTCSVGVSRKIEAALRFHLHPRVLVSLIQDGKEALLRLPGGAGWRFVCSGGVLTLENSVYLGEGTRPRKTKQLVVSLAMESDRALIKWALQREAR